MTKYFAIGCDADFTIHVIRVYQLDSQEIKVVATFNAWWRAMKFTNAMNREVFDKERALHAAH